MNAVLLLGAVVLSADVASAQFHGRIRIKPRGGREVASDVMWFVADVVQDGQRVRGRVALVGAPEISVGRCEGRMRENGKVGGKIIDEDGRRWAVLRGSAVSDGITGTFQLRGGVPGDWEESERRVNGDTHNVVGRAPGLREGGQGWPGSVQGTHWDDL